MTGTTAFALSKAAIKKALAGMGILKGAPAQVPQSQITHSDGKTNVTFLWDARNETMSFTVGATGGEYKHQLTVAELARHTHPVTAKNNKVTTVGGSGIWGLYSDDTFNTASTGNDTPHNNMQPYKVVYMWERTA